MPRLTITYRRLLYLLARVNTNRKGKNSFLRKMSEVEWDLAMEQLKELNIIL